MISPDKIEHSARSVSLKLREGVLGSSRLRPLAAAVLYSAGRVGLVNGPIYLRQRTKRFPVSDELQPLSRGALPLQADVARLLSPLVESLVDAEDIVAVHGLRDDEPDSLFGHGIPYGMETSGSSRINLLFPFCVEVGEGVRESRGGWAWAHIDDAAELIFGATPTLPEAVANIEILDRTMALIPRSQWSRPESEF